MTTIHSVDAITLDEWLGNDEAILVDVREPAEHKTESIPGGINQPLSKIADKSVSSLGGDRKLVFYCQSGRRSNSACEKLRADQFSSDIWDLDGGLVAWKEAGLPVKKSAKRILPLDRQVQLTVGLMILVGMALGHFVAYPWLLLPLIVGLGLINASLTGWCGMARFIAKMPWNQG